MQVTADVHTRTWMHHCLRTQIYPRSNLFAMFITYCLICVFKLCFTQSLSMAFVVVYIHYFYSIILKLENLPHTGIVLQYFLIAFFAPINVPIISCLTAGIAIITHATLFSVSCVLSHLINTHYTKKQMRLHNWLKKVSV